ncbi:hypothetical protein [Streptomyces sp. NBC_01353]|uniref:hypothetical protein n=1 Tax=Streptomyces sp. NBC_01353 TaxID=2903835 RepID=UPI002E36C7BC|nr:hypothetical protein [Streptomyces sp. NBC_01353]
MPRVLFETATLETLDPATTGAVWRLAEPGRQVDANVVRIPPERSVDPHTEQDLDVLLLVVARDGTMVTSEGTCPLSEGSLAWLPHGSTRGLVAGKRGMAYLTIHRRCPGMRIQPASGSRDPAALTMVGLACAPQSARDPGPRQQRAYSRPWAVTVIAS